MNLQELKKKSPAELISQAEKLEIENPSTLRKQEILFSILKKLAQKNEVSAGKDPMGLAAAALYLACVKNDEDKTQRDIAEAANVTEVTIRNRYKGLKDTVS